MRLNDDPTVPCQLHEAIAAMHRWQALLPTDTGKPTIPTWMVEELRGMRADGVTLVEILRHGRRFYPDLTKPMLDTLLERKPSKRHENRVTDAQWEELYARHFGLGETYERLEQYAREVMGIRASRGYINRVLKSMHERKTGYVVSCTQN